MAPKSATALSLMTMLAATTTTMTESPTNPSVIMETSMGSITLELYADSAPETVKNFIDLAEGRKEFTYPEGGETVKRPFYDGLVFHRVIADFMIQGGCPKGNGTGGPGYEFKDEINGKDVGLDELKAMENGKPHQWLFIRDQNGFNSMIVGPLLAKMGIQGQEALEKRREEVTKRVNELTVLDVYSNLGYQFDESLDFHKPERGVIAMANSGPNTNGSQFFINVVDTPHLNGKHTVFGKVTDGMDVVDAISKVAVDQNSKPEKPVTINTIRTVEP